MAYRKFYVPEHPRTLGRSDWVDWAASEGVLASVAPTLSATCAVCFGAVGVDTTGIPYTQCQHCWQYRTTVAGVVPVLYSIDSGFESLLHQYKDFGAEHRWLARPIASVLDDFLTGHIGCISARYGAIEIATVVPSGNQLREFDHLGLVISQIGDWAIQWDLNMVEKVKDGRPGRGVVDPSYYLVSPNADLDGKTVLLVDDTWTSGSSVVSVARALRDHGAKGVVALPIGRQLNANFGDAGSLMKISGNRGYNNETCVICG